MKRTIALGVALIALPQIAAAAVVTRGPYLQMPTAVGHHRALADRCRDDEPGRLRRGARDR